MIEKLDKFCPVRYNAGMKILLFYLVMINLAAFGLMAADKRRAWGRSRVWSFAATKQSIGILWWECR